jgi:hypothetical protein
VCPVYSVFSIGVTQGSVFVISLFCIFWGSYKVVNFLLCKRCNDGTISRAFTLQIQGRQFEFRGRQTWRSMVVVVTLFSSALHFRGRLDLTFKIENPCRGGRWHIKSGIVKHRP